MNALPRLSDLGDAHPLLTATIRVHDDEERANSLASLREAVARRVKPDIFVDRQNRVVKGRLTRQFCVDEGVTPNIVRVADDEIAMIIQIKSLGRALSADERLRAVVGLRLAGVDICPPGTKGKKRDVVAKIADVGSGRNLERWEKLAERHPETFALLGTELRKSDVTRITHLEGPEEVEAIRLITEEGVKPVAAYHAVRKSFVTRQIVEIARVPGKYVLILVDPPWTYEMTGATLRSAAGNEYRLMTFEELVGWAQHIDRLACEDSLLLMWATVPHLFTAGDLMKAWRFEYISNMVWVKPGIGKGYVAGRIDHEHLLIGRRGRGLPRIANDVSSVIGLNDCLGKIAEILVHSEKPESAFHAIERMWPSGRRIEIFARGAARMGWDHFGDQAESSLGVVP